MSSFQPKRRSGQQSRYADAEECAGGLILYTPSTAFTYKRFGFGAACGGQAAKSSVPRDSPTFAYETICFNRYQNSDGDSMSVNDPMIAPVSGFQCREIDGAPDRCRAGRWLPRETRGLPARVSLVHAHEADRRH